MAQAFREPRRVLSAVVREREEAPVRKLSSAAAMIILGLAACGSPEPTDEAGAEPVQPESSASPQQTVAALRDAEGQSVGTATATESGGAVAISLTVQGLPSGEHGVHV